MNDVSLYEQLGGYAAIVVIANALFPRLVAEEQLVRFWGHKDEDEIALAKQLFIDFVAQQTGGEISYQGRDMQQLHDRMQIDVPEWLIFMRHLNDTLDELGLSDRQRQGVQSFVKTTMEGMVEQH